MALGTLSLSTVSGVQGRRFAAKIAGLTTGRVEIGGDGSPGFSVVNGLVSSNSLPYPTSTVVLREYDPGATVSVKETRIDITAVTAYALMQQATAALGVGRSLVSAGTYSTTQADGSTSYSLYVRDDLGATTVQATGGTTPVPIFTAQPSISPTSGASGSTFTATPGAVSNGAVASRAWLLNGTSISTGLTATPGSAGTLTYQEFASGAGGTAQSAVQSATVSAAATVPAAPTITVTPGNAQNSIAWTDGSNGGASITSHNLYRGTTSGGETLLGTIMTGSPYLDTGLTNGQAYYYKLSAVNSVGEGAQSSEASGTPVASATFMQAATAVYQPSALTTSGTTSMTRKSHVARDNISSIKLGYLTSYRSATAGERTALGAALPIKAWVEYPSGTYTPITFASSASPTLADSSLSISDAVSLPSTIPSGAQFWTWTYAGGQAPAVASLNTPLLSASLGEGFTSAASGVPTVPSTTTPATTSGAVPLTPVLILAPTTVKSAALFGTSRTISVTDATSTTTGDRGALAKTLGPVMAYGNYGVAGDSQTTWLTDPILPQLATYYTHIVANDQTNNLYVQAGQAAGSMAYEARWAARFKGKPYIRQTMEDHATSTDSFATTANQTQTTQGAQIQATNVLIRAATDAPYLEVESGIGADLTTGRGWSVAGSPPNTTDGLHANAAGTAQEIASGTILASTVTGAANYNSSWTPVALTSSPAFSTTSQKFGTGFLSTGGLAAWGLIPTSGDFTVECWVNRSSFGNALFLGNALVGLSCTTAGLITASAPGQTGLTSSTSIADGAWHHVALVSTKTAATLYIDGVAVSSVTAARTFLNATNRSFGLRGPGVTTGAVTAVTTAPQLDELAIWATAKYTAAFTPPTSPYVGTEAGLVALMHLDDATIVVGPAA